MTVKPDRGRLLQVVHGVPARISHLPLLALVVPAPLSLRAQCMLSDHTSPLQRTVDMDIEAIRQLKADIRKKIEEKGSREARTSGNPHESDIDRELSQRGVQRTPGDIPAQDQGKRSPDAPVEPIQFRPSTAFTYKYYKIGAASRPQNIHHDPGFSKHPKGEPTWSDHVSYLAWLSMLEGAKVARPDLSDATAAYAHFLANEGKDREFSYERYAANDRSGQVSLRNAVLEAQFWAIELWHDNRKPESFSFTGPAIRCGSNDEEDVELRRMFPYPATENWQKTIGAHYIWLSGLVTVENPRIDRPKFNMQFTLHAEDQYNFNPGDSDKATGILDEENGKFVVAGLAKGYRHRSTLQRNYSWAGFDLGVQHSGFNVPVIGRSPVASRR